MNELDLRVCDVVNEEGWHLSNLATTIPGDTMQKLLEWKMFLHHSFQDTVVWNSEISGEFLTKSGYWWLIKCDFPSNMGSGWKSIWQRNLLENIKFFL